MLFSKNSKQFKNPIQGVIILQKIFQTAIVGGGASGLMTAVELCSGKNALFGGDVLILERNDRVGKKLIATGNGQGNLTNQNFGAEFYRGEEGFINAFVDAANQINISEYLFELGIPVCAYKDGKVYPVSRQASAVLDVIRGYLTFKGCKEITNAQVRRIIKENDYYKLITEQGDFLAKTVVLATGGAAAKQFGTDGSAYALAESFGHKKTKLYPSLVQLKTQTDLIKGLKGLKEVAKVSAYRNKELLCQSTGDLLFTEYGVSGNAVFQVSAYLTGSSEEYLLIEFLPDLDRGQVVDIINKKLAMPHINKEEVLSGLINKRIGQALMKSVKNYSAQAIASAVKSFKLKITGNLGFNYAQMTKGGICTDKINAKTMESKLVKGFYIVGEALDVDGDCGGYNVTFAFVSGITAARAIKNENKK